MIIYKDNVRYIKFYIKILIPTDMTYKLSVISIGIKFSVLKIILFRITYSIKKKNR